MEQEDPYAAIKSEIDRELQHVATLQARLFAGHGDVAAQLHDALHNIDEELAALEAAVQRMVGDPAKFNLTPSAAFGRQVEVETLRYTLTDLQRVSAEAQTSSSGRTAAAAAGSQRDAAVELSAVKLAAPGSTASSTWHIRADGAASVRPPGGSSSGGGGTTGNGGKGGSSSSSSTMPRPPPGPPIRHSKLVQSHRGGPTSAKPPQRPPLGALAAGGGDDTRGGWGPDANGSGGGSGVDVSYEAMMQQQVAQQDEALDHIAVHVECIKETGRLMHEELEEQAGLLSGLQDDVDTSHLRLRGLRKKVADVIKQARRDRQLCLIIVLSVVLVILTVLAIA